LARADVTIPNRPSAPDDYSDECADTEANHLGNLHDADSLGELGSCLAQLVWLSTRARKALPDLAMLAYGMRVPLNLIHGTL
jgi:hypothetical protein